MKPRFLHRDLSSPSNKVNLESSEAHHLTHVLRLKRGDRVELFDGKGHLAESEIQTISRSQVELQIIGRTHSENTNQITVGFGIAKAAAIEFIIRRCTELGVRSFQPLITDHSLHPKEFNDSRWEKLSVEVLKQCQNLYLPEIEKPISLSKWLQERSAHYSLFLATESKRQFQSPAVSGSPFLLIGPEGGWSQKEESELESKKATLIGLGPNRLRTETAALVGLTLLKCFSGELKQ